MQRILLFASLPTSQHVVACIQLIFSGFAKFICRTFERSSDDARVATYTEDTQHAWSLNVCHPSYVVYIQSYSTSQFVPPFFRLLAVCLIQSCAYALIIVRQKWCRCELIVLTFSTRYCLDLAQLQHRHVIVTTFVDIDYLVHCNGFGGALLVMLCHRFIYPYLDGRKRMEKKEKSEMRYDGTQWLWLWLWRRETGKMIFNDAHINSYILCVRRAYVSRFIDHMHSPYLKAAPISQFQFTEYVCEVDGPLMNYFRSRLYLTHWHNPPAYVGTFFSQHTNVTIPTVWITWARTIVTQTIMKDSEWN